MQGDACLISTVLLSPVRQYWLMVLIENLMLIADLP